MRELHNMLKENSYRYLIKGKLTAVSSEEHKKNINLWEENTFGELQRKFYHIVRDSDKTVSFANLQNYSFLIQHLPKSLNTKKMSR